MSTNVPIASITLSSATPSVTFSGIPQTYTDLVLVCRGQLSGNGSFIMRLNNDTGSNYSFAVLEGTGSVARAARGGDPGAGFITGFWSFISASNDFSTITNLNSYSNTNIFKTWVNRGNVPSQWVDTSVGNWRNTDAITSITLFPNTGVNMNAGSTFSLYGINAANSAQAKATGGDSIYRDASYWYHVFNSSGTFRPTQNITGAEFIVAAGGGGGSGGGGGAGGFRAATSQSFNAETSYTFTIGAGGAPGTTGNIAFATSGSGSSISGSGFSTFNTSGGAMGRYEVNPNVAGGSGGGGTGNTDSSSYIGTAGNAGGYTPVEGYAGGNGATGGGNRGAGGGGGAGGIGGTGNTGSAGAGGVGTNAYSSWATATFTGVNGHYAGGGGGGIQFSSTGGAGGTGGGGQGGGTSTPAGRGSANTGGGGGGGGYATNGGAGGSGIIIVRYPV